MLQTSSGEASIDLLRETGAALFVINLCASTTPVALAHPDTPELKRFTFFVTRRREEGRERFRLHMGYFDTLEQAEAMLAAVRDIYPAAWAGPAPDHRGPARAAPKPALVVATPAAPAPAPAAAAAPAEAAPAAAGLAVAPAATPATNSPPAPGAHQARAAAPAAPAARAARNPKQEVVQSFEETMSNVREVLAQLGDDSATSIAPAVEPARPAPRLVTATPPPVPLHDLTATTLTPAQALALLESTAEAPAAPRAPSEALRAPQAQSATPAEAIDPAATSSSIRVLTPEDTQTLRDIRLEQQQNASASYAVQLVWSVQPIDTDALPHLAIFDAYTLYHVEGNRNGRRWYGLRLGFFTDPEAARQVAHYVRSEYATVAVVPVTTREKNGATGTAGAAEPAVAEVPALPKAAPARVTAAPPKPAPATAAAPRPAPPRTLAPAQAAAARSAPRTLAPATPLPRPQPAQIPTVKPLEALPAPDLAGFELLPDEPRAPKRDLEDATQAAPRAAATPKSQPPHATGKAPGKRAVVRPRPPQSAGGPKTLEETLEILGASTLTLDESREVVNDAALRKTTAPKKERTGRFARLLSRLSDRNAG